MHEAKQATDIAVIEKEINPIVNSAEKIVIAGEKDMKEATEILSKLNLASDKTIERLETITKPAKASIKAAEAVWTALYKRIEGGNRAYSRKDGHLSDGPEMTARERKKQR